jgi:hypothetical protein
MWMAICINRALDYTGIKHIKLENWMLATKTEVKSCVCECVFIL